MPRATPFASRLSALALTISVGVGAMPSLSRAEGHAWKSIAGRHFSVSYDQSTRDLAEQALGIAEATAEQLEGFFGWRQGLERIAIVLTDDDDYSNGYSMGRTPLVRIYCRKTPLDWRGETRWLETVLSHELSHVYTLMQMERSFALSVGVGQHDDERREDAQFQVSWGVDDLPRWFVEGMAQVGSVAFQADGRDPWREALLADAFRTGRILSLEEMGRFEGTSREAELTYNQGFDLVLFLRARYPRADFRSLCRRVGESGFEEAVRATYGKPLRELYAEWFASLAARFPALPAVDPATALFQGHDGPLVAETGASGNYAVANWRHDGLRSDLFEIDPKGGEERVARDVGEKVVVDPANGDAWYSQMLLNTGKDAQQYDIFRRTRGGEVSRETSGARCLAFDVAFGSLVYARYDAGVTDLVRRDLSSGAETLLRRFPRDTAVYQVSIASPDSVYLSLGAGEAVRAAVVAKGALEVLWPDGPAVLSAASIGGDTLALVVVDSGVPRLAWSNGHGAWHRIGGAVAARSVWLDRAGRRILSSVYEQGSFRIRTVAPNFADTTEIVKSVSKAPGQRVWNAGRSLTLAPTWIRMPLYFELGFGIYGRSDRFDTTTSSAWQAHVTEEWTDPTQSWGLGVRGGSSLFPSGADMPQALPAASVWGWHQDGSRVFQAGYSYRENARTYRNDTIKVVSIAGTHSMQASADAAFSNQFAARLEGAYHWQTQSITAEEVGGDRRKGSEDYGTVLTLLQGGVAFGYGESDSRLDPAGLGAPGYQAQVQADVFQATALDDIVGGEKIWRPARTYGDAMAAFGARAWIEDLASLAAKFDAYGVVGGIDSLDELPGSVSSMGGDAPFRGYADQYLDLRAFARATLELRMSPFATRSAKVSWHDRTRLALRLEAGGIQYLSLVQGYTRSGVKAAAWEERTAPALSWDLSVRQGFVVSNTATSWLEAGIAMPLTSIGEGRREDPFRLFFGLFIN